MANRKHTGSKAAKPRAEDQSPARREWFRLYAKYNELLKPFVDKLLEPGSNEYNRYNEIISARSKELGEWRKQYLDTEEIGTLDDLLEWIKSRLLLMEMVAEAGGNDPIAKRGESIRAQILDKIHDLRLANMGKGIVGLPPSPDLPEDPQLALRVARDWVLTAKNATSARTQDQKPQQAHEDAGEDSRRPSDLICTRIAVRTFGVSRSTLLRKVNKGTLKSYREPDGPLNRQHLFSEEELARLFERKYTRPH